MTGEEHQESRRMSPELKWYLLFARFIFVPASGLAVIGILSCLAIGALGEFRCALPLDSIIMNGSQDFFGFAVLSAFFLALIWGLGGRYPEMIDKLADAFDDYSFPSVYIFSTTIPWAQFVCIVFLLFAFVALCVPIGIVIYEFRAVWSSCVMGASGSA